MNIEMKARIGETLSHVLAPFHDVDGCPLKAVWEATVDDCIEVVQLEFEPGFLTFTADSDDDTVDLSFTKLRRAEALCVNHLDPWRQLMGSNFGWGWVGINQQGYLDSVSFSFQSVTPQYSITAVASSLRLAEIHDFATKEHAHRATEPLYQPAAKYA